MVRQHVHPKDVDAGLAIQLQATYGVDKIFRKANAKGLFALKSVYRLLDGNLGPLPRPLDESDWKKLWA